MDYSKYFDILDRDGYVVIPNVISDDRCDEILSMLINETCKGYGISGKDFNKRLPDIMWRSQKICNLQGEGMWNIRTDKNIMDLYKQLWFHHLPQNELENNSIELSDDIYLTCSLDGFCITANSLEKPKPSWNNNDPGWLHSDQSKDHVTPFEWDVNSKICDNNENDPIIKPDISEIRSCVQGQLLLKDCNEGESSFCVLKGSHKLWKECHTKFDNHFKSNTYFNMINKNIFNWFLEKGCEHIKVYCPKGSMILWYSCTIHSGSGPTKDIQPLVITKNKKEIKYYNGRAVAFVNYTPNWWCNSKDWDNKNNAFTKGLGTNHWTYGNGMSINGTKPFAPRGAIMLIPITKIDSHVFDKKNERKEIQTNLLFAN